MKKKAVLITIMLAGFLLLSGFGLKLSSIELLDDAPLIDLDRAISLALPGGDGIDDNDGAALDAGSIGKGTSLASARKNNIISIKDRVTTYNNTPCDTAELEKFIRRDNAKGTEVTLVDNYAEASVYKAALRVLKKLEAELGLKYSCR